MVSIICYICIMGAKLPYILNIFIHMHMYVIYALTICVLARGVCILNQMDSIVAQINQLTRVAI